MLAMTISTVEITNASPRYQMIDLGAMNQSITQSEAIAINNLGHVVGLMVTTGGIGVQPFLYQSDILNGLGFVGSARAINDAGVIVGGLGGDPSFGAFKYEAGVRIDLGTLGGSSSVAYDINESGQIVGLSRIAPDSHRERAFLYSNGVMNDLGSLGGGESVAFSINDNGIIAGQSLTTGGEVHAAMHSGGQWYDLGTLGGTSSQAYAINSSGWVVGVSERSDGIDSGFLYRDGLMSEIAYSPLGNSDARDINNMGQIVGVIHRATGNVGYVYEDGELTELGLLPSGSYSVAEAINDHGWIVGHADVADGNGQRHAVLWIPIPEPATGVYSTAALFALATHRKRVTAST